MKFIDCESGLIINLEHISEVDTDERSIILVNGSTHYMCPDLFERFMCEIKKHLI